MHLRLRKAPARLKATLGTQFMLEVRAQMKLGAVKRDYGGQAKRVAMLEGVKPERKSIADADNLAQTTRHEADTHLSRCPTAGLNAAPVQLHVDRGVPAKVAQKVRDALKQILAEHAYPEQYGRHDILRAQNEAKRKR